MGELSMEEMPMKGDLMGVMPVPGRRTGAKTILLTGFQPFGGLTENPALEILKRVPRTVGGCAVERAEIPVTYEGCSRVAVEAVERVRPCAVVMVGQARGRADIEVERVAINVDDCDSPDNDGVVRQGVAVVEGGPAAYFATIPVVECVRSVRACGVPASVSNTAGTYVCNHLMYSVLDCCAHRFPEVNAGFVHVPLMTAQAATAACAGDPSMSVDDMVRGLTAVLETVAETFRDEGGE